jgi:hypothetical protein
VNIPERFTSTLIFEISPNLSVQRETQRPRGTTIRYALSFYGTLGFVAGFFGARLIATLTGITVVHGGIHFHHFWYGLTMVVVTGWLGIAITTERHGRTLATIFGLGVGFIGDEVGLLLTFGDYQSELTTWFFAGAISIIILLTLVLRFRSQLERDVLGLSTGEAARLAGISIAVFSSIFFANNSLEIGTVVACLGILLFLLGIRLERRPKSLQRWP